MASRSEFGKFMVALGQLIPKFAPRLDTPQLLEPWYRELEHYEPADLARVYKQAVRQFDAFPSLRELMALFDGDGVLMTADEEATAAPMLIWAAIEKHGTMPGRDESITRDIGPFAVALVQRLGGWDRVAASATNANKTTIIAQWRDTARAMAPLLATDAKTATLRELEGVHQKAYLLAASEPGNVVDLAKRKNRKLTEAIADLRRPHEDG